MWLAFFIWKGSVSNMSAAHNIENTTGVNGTRYGIGNRAPINHPQNCSQECPYGHDRPFCFPCYKKLVGDKKRKRV
jgi:hypothetical protein